MKKYTLSNKKLTKSVIALLCIIAIAELFIIIFLVFEDNNSKDEDTETEDEMALVNDIASYTETLPSTTPVQKEEIVIPEGYQQISVNDINTGVYVKDLEKYKTGIQTEDEYCLIDNNIIFANYFNEELTGLESEAISIDIAVRELVGEETFAELAYNFDNQIMDTSSFGIINQQCVGYNLKKISGEIQYPQFLDETLGSVYVGNYQYLPSVKQPIGYTTLVIYKNDEYIIEIKYSSDTNSGPKFNEVDGIDLCTKQDEGVPESFYVNDLSCAAYKISQSPEILRQIVEHSQQVIETEIIINL